MESQQPQVAKLFKPKNKSKEPRNVYSLSQITKSISLPINAIGKGLYQTIERTIAAMVEGKCIVEGFVKTGSVRVITYSSGLVKSDSVLFNVVFECSVCYPVAGMLMNCIAKNITKAGIRAESSEETPSPFVLFIARDHYYASDYFNSIEEKEKFTARVIAQRFELNDKYVSIIAELVPQKEYVQKKPRLNLGADI
jgi:DNA-directed RNA polymerase subunit E'/Rpb7